MTERPDLAALELLDAVSRYGSLNAAANALGVAQPNATRVLRRLERELRRPLLTRHARGSVLTAEGAKVLEAARPLLDAAEQFLQRINEPADSLLVAASQTVAETLTGRWLGELCTAHPSLTASLQVCNSEEVLRRVRDGSVQLGFIESEVDVTGLDSRVVGHDQLAVVVHPEHPWAERRDPISIDELAKTPLVVREMGSGTRSVLATRLGREVRAALELSSNTAVLTAVAEGVAPAVLSELAVAQSWAAGRVLLVPSQLDLRRDLRAIWQIGMLSKLGQELLGIAARKH